MAKREKSVGQRTKSGRFVIGGAAFAKISAVEGISLTDAMKKRADDKRSKGLTSEEHRRAIVRSHRKEAANFLAELNAIHAFRDGNGRSQLTFLALLAHQAEHPLNLDRLDPDEMMTAMIASFDGDEDKLDAVIRGLVA